MNKILYIILSLLLFSLTVISCAKKDDSSSSSSSSSGADESSSGADESSSGVNETPTCPDCIVLYIDKGSLSKYKTNNYLLLDPFEGHRQNGLVTEDFEFYHESGSFPDMIDLTENAPTLGETFTIEMWIFPDRLGEQHQRIIGPTPRISFHMAIDEASEIRYGLNNKSIRVQRIIKNVDWYHVAITYDSNDDFIFYLNGEEVDRYKHLKGRGISPDNATRYIGGKEDGGKFLGKIDDVRMWNVVRSQAEIKAKMNQTLTGNETGLVAYYPMDLNNDWELVDLSPNNNNVKIGRRGPLSRAATSSGKFTGDFIINEEIRPRYFSDDCPDGPDGSLTCPFPTIRSAMDNLYKRIKNGQYGGYHLYIREGRYTEVLNKWHLNKDNQMDMSKVQPIVFEGYPNEKVIIDGTVALNDNSSNWQQATHRLDNGTIINIYKTVINFDNISREIKTPISSIYQLFVNDRYMIPAMPMNFKNPTDPTTGNPKNPEPNTIWSLSQRTEEEAIVQVEGEETIDEENIDNSTLYDNATMLAQSITPSGRPSSKGGPYVPGSLEFFDGVEEWAFDNNTKTLYLYASDNFTPNSTNVRIRVRDRIVNIRNSENITFKNIDFFAGSITIRGTKHFTLENCRFSFNSDMGLLHNTIEYSPISTVRNCIFEYINDGHSWSQQLSGHPVLENVLFRYNDWFGGTAWSPTTDRNYRGDNMAHAEAQGDQSWYGTQWRYITIENSYTAGIFAGPRSLIEYARLENLYEGCDCSAIQRNAAGARYSTTRFTWIINAPYLNGMRFDSKCGARFGDVHNVVSVGNRRGFRLKGDFHDVYHVNAYDNRRQDITLSVDKYCGPDIEGGREKAEPGNWNSNIHNVLVGGSFQCFSEDCWAEGTDPMTNKTGVFNPWFDFPQLDSVGIWFGRQLSGQGSGWSSPKKELGKPWIQMRSLPESKLIDKFGANPWDVPDQDYDFRPKKGSSLIDSGVMIPGINDGKDTGVPHPEDGIDFNHPPLYSGQKRKFVGEAPDIGAYEYGDSVYWIPGFRYPHPSVPIPNDGALEVPIDYSLVWNYPYKKDYSNTKASVKVSGPGVNLTKEFKYPHNVFFQAFEPGGTYNWSVTVDNVSGGNWSFKTDDKIYPLNDRSVNTTDKKSLLPYQINNLEVSQNKIAFLLFDIPSSINGNHKIKLNLVPESVVSLNGEIEVYKYDYKGWGEKTDKNNIGIIDHSLGTKLATLTSLQNGTAVSVDLTDQIYSYGEEFSIALKVSDSSDKVYFYSKEKGITGKGIVPNTIVWPYLSFQ